eukprot:TRINITY_DN980_c0_g1_i9.p1 TRINITY_DN980_c0_g1~~TRINITY_DN980_c0_g1_i9.p1  ORF type:complete len:191 (-),score=1.90 TRINITY_DN980_c0_g1_i9:98-670(-)
MYSQGIIQYPVAQLSSPIDCDNFHAAFVILTVMSDVFSGFCFIRDFNNIALFFKSGLYMLGGGLLVLYVFKRICNIWWLFMIYHDFIARLPIPCMKEISKVITCFATNFIVVGFVVQVVSIYVETGVITDIFTNLLVIEYLLLTIGDFLAIIVAGEMENKMIYRYYPMYIPVQENQISNKPIYSIAYPQH